MARQAQKPHDSCGIEPWLGAGACPLLLLCHFDQPEAPGYQDLFPRTKAKPDTHSRWTHADRPLATGPCSAVPLAPDWESA